MTPTRASSPSNARSRYDAFAPATFRTSSASAWRTVCLVLAAVLASCFARAAVTTGERAFDLPNDTAERSLKRLAEQSGLEVVFSTELAAKVRTNSVKGEFPPLEAAKRMLAGTALQAAQKSEAGAIVVTHRGGSSPSEKNVPRAAQANGDRPEEQSPTGNLAPRPRASGDADGDTITLSPFTVSTAKDEGYLAASTLAGSRLNTSLLDTPASISVMTKDFLEDIGATNVTDALAYSVNAEPDRTHETGNPSASQDLPLSIRGFGGASLGRNYFQWGLESDVYNVERLDFSRGPNSILFGTGGPGGIINTTTKRAGFGRSVQQLGLRVGAWDSYRATLDLGRQMTKNLAVRVNTVLQSTKSWRDYEASDRKGAALAVTYRPFRNTEIRFDGEYGEFDRILSNPFLPGDSVSAWVAAGRPISTAFGQVVPGTIRNTSAAFAHDPITGKVMRWSGSVNTASAGSAASSTISRVLTDFSILPLKSNPGGDGNISDSRFSSTGLFIEQRFGDLWIEAAANRQDQGRLWLNSSNWFNNVIRADANAFLPDGQPNPNVGKLYIETRAQQFTFDTVTDDLRLTAAYTLDLNERSPWLGSYAITGLMSRRTEETRNDNLWEVNLTPTGSQNLANNGLFRRAYFDPFGPGPKGGYDVRKYQFSQGGVTSGFARIQNQGIRGREVLDSRMVAAQAKILQDRLVVTGGLRHDRQKNFDGTATADPVTGVFPLQTLDPTSTDFEGDTKTFGAVLHLTKWSSVFYNRSDNFVPQSALTISGAQLGPRRGQGKDYGLKFRLLDGRVYASITRYETDEQNRLVVAATNLINSINEILEAIGNPTRHSGITTRDGIETEGRGHEFELTANLTQQWRFTANFAQTEGIQANNQPRLRAYIDERRAAWEARASMTLVGPSPGVPDPDPKTGRRPTVATALDQIDFFVDRILGANGVTRRQLREYTGSVFTAYTFRSDSKWRDELTVGVGARYRGKPVVGYRNGNESIFGKSETTVNLMFAKNLRVFDRRVRLQANLDNILNVNDPIVADASDEGVFRLLYPNPFRWSLSATVRL